MKTKVFDKSKKDILKRMGFDVESANKSDINAAKSRKIKALLDNNAGKYSQAVADIRKSFSALNAGTESEIKKDSKEGELK